MCHLRAVVYTTVQFSKPLLCFRKEVLHMLSSQGWVSDFTQRFRSFLSQPPTSTWFSPTFCVPGPFSWSSVYTGFFSFPYHCTFPATTSASGMVWKKRGKNNSYFPHILWTIGISFSVSLVKEKDYLSSVWNGCIAATATAAGGQPPDWAGLQSYQKNKTKIQNTKESGNCLYSLLHVGAQFSDPNQRKREFLLEIFLSGSIVQIKNRGYPEIQARR